MGCNLDHHSHKSISIHKKVFNERNGVDHSPVPRKIRSAMKKRGREPILTDSEKLKYGIESPQKDSIKKSKELIDLPGSEDFSVVSGNGAGGIDCKQEQHIIKYRRENEGLTLWPGASPRESVAINVSSSQSSAAAKAPHWLNAAISNPKHDLMESISSGGKISKTAIPRKSWKSCAAHVHISQLIRSLELPKQQVAKEPELYE
ncbi:hypothetical protein KIW84_076723 [Lathyrus oleraceus]|uniref:Uncharacterized protein n=1 Tax=Pisum sativum TaxID=3888 RepID=A0A9D4VZZ5_PEA|nr:hypothetical protein KIW84_076723 [Pisum sativum]